MPIYYCHQCGREEGLLNPLYPTDACTEAPNLSGTDYQLGKFMKHTIPQNSQCLISIFNDPAYQTYESYIVDTSVSGCCEIDKNGRTNLIYYAGRNNGFSIRNGSVQYPTNGTKVVLHDNEDRIHAFPVDVNYIPVQKCSRCGRDILA